MNSTWKPAEQWEKWDKWILSGGAAIFLLFICLFGYTGNFFLLAVPFGMAILCWLIFDWKSFFWFFLLTIPLSCEIQLGNGVLSTSVPDEQLMWLFVPATIFIVLYNYRILPKWFLEHPITLILFLQFVWLVVSVIFSQNHLLSFKFLAAKIWFLCSFVILPVLVFREKKDFKKAFLLITVPIILHAIVAFSWHMYLHFDFWASNDVVRPFYFNHVDYSTVLSMIFPLLLVAYQLCKGKPRQRFVLLLVIIFFIPAIYFAAARAAMLAVVFSLVIAFAIRKKLVNLIMPGFFAFIILVVSLISYNNNYIKYRPNMKYTATQRTFSDLITATFRGHDMSSMERFYRWIASIKMSTEHPMVGVGPNNFYDHYKGHTVPMFKTWVSRNPERSTTHNYFLFMLVEQGWPSMLLYAVLLVVVFAQAQKIYHRARDPFYKKVTMGLIMMFAAGFVNNFFSELLETHKIGALFFISITLLIVVDHLTKKEEAGLAEAGVDRKA
jgi:O-antigen ligase